MAKFLITGGAGFIGGNYLHIMTKKYPNDFFVCLDCLTYAGNIETLKPIFSRKNFKFIRADITKKREIFDIFKEEQFDYVINFAAESHVDRSIKNPSIFLKTNIIGVQILMDASLKYNVKRFHQVSTDEVYGDLPINRKDLLFDEKSPLTASSPYSASKAAADLLVMAYHRTFHLNATISRCSNNYGPYQFPEKLIPLVINSALQNKQIPIYGTGENIRDWLYVEDHCTAIDLIVRSGIDGEIYNIGGHNEKSNVDVVKTIIRHLNKSENLITFIKDRPGHDLRYAINPNKLEKKLNWKPGDNFDTGIIKTIEWYKNNLEWLKNVETKEYLKWIKLHYK